MKKPLPKARRAQTHREEIANTLSHLTPALVILALSPLVLIRANQQAGLTGLITYSIFLFSIFTMLLTSSLYHGVKPGRRKERLHRMDHIAIFIAIAGTYTPIALLVIGGISGWILVSIQWALVAAGAIVKLTQQKNQPRASLLIYLAMGWLVLVFGYQFFKSENWGLISLIFLGGVFYSLGSLFYRQSSRYHYCHLVWHFFVLAGVVSQLLGLWIFI